MDSKATTLEEPPLQCWIQWASICHLKERVPYVCLLGLLNSLNGYYLIFSLTAVLLGFDVPQLCRIYFPYVCGKQNYAQFYYNKELLSTIQGQRIKMNFVHCFREFLNSQMINPNSGVECLDQEQSKRVKNSVRLLQEWSKSSNTLRLLAQSKLNKKIHNISQSVFTSVVG